MKIENYLFCLFPLSNGERDALNTYNVNIESKLMNN